MRLIVSLLLIGITGCKQGEAVSKPVKPSNPQKPEPPEAIHSFSYTPIYDASIKEQPLKGDFLLFDWTKAGYGENNLIPDLSNEPIFHVKDYGAIPDDGLDDLAGIQAAIDTAVANGGGIVQLDAGLYELNINDSGAEFKHSDALWVKGSNVIIQGVESDGVLRTTIKQHKIVTNGSEGDNGVRSDHTINFGGDNVNQKPISGKNNTIIQPIEVGDTSVYFQLKNGAEAIEVGDTVKISMLSWLPPKIPDDPDNFKLMNELLSPLYGEGDDDEYNADAAYVPFAFFAKIKESHSEQWVTLDRPMPRDMALSFNPHIQIVDYSQGVIQNCGVENLNIINVNNETSSSVEGKYYSGGVNFYNVYNCFANNITISDTILDVSINNSRNVTVKHVNILGRHGHHSLGFYGSYDSYISDVNYYTGRNHMVSFNDNASYNVIRNVVNHYESSSNPIDYHSGYSSFNLMENIKNTTIASSGGRLNNSSSAQYNVLWNSVMRTSSNNKKSPNELYQYCWYVSSAYTGKYKEDPYQHCYRRHPKMIYVGLTHIDKEERAYINNNDFDLIDEWRYIEGINNSAVYPKSLYLAQVHGEQTDFPKLSGIENITINIGDKFDPIYGISANSASNEDLTQEIIIEGMVDTSKENISLLSYSVTDMYGLTTTIRRQVTVTEL